MKKTLIAAPVAAVMAVSTLGVATATTATAAPAAQTAVAQSPTQTEAQKIRARKIRARKYRLRIRKRARYAGISTRMVRRYRINATQARQIRMAKRWARTSKARSVRRCESGGSYRINTGNGYYGAYQFAAGTWVGVGGRKYARYAHRAPRFGQDHMAWKLYQRSGWGPWGCA